jgi:hypothetical protein
MNCIVFGAGSKEGGGGEQEEAGDHQRGEDGEQHGQVQVQRKGKVESNKGECEKKNFNFFLAGQFKGLNQIEL